jgi:hypothetical protein
MSVSTFRLDEKTSEAGRPESEKNWLTDAEATPLRCPHDVWRSWACTVCHSNFAGPKTPHWDSAYKPNKRKPSIKLLTIDDCNEVLANARLLGIAGPQSPGYVKVRNRLIELETQIRNRLACSLEAGFHPNLEYPVEALPWDWPSFWPSMELLQWFFQVGFPGAHIRDYVRGNFYDENRQGQVETVESVPRERLARGEEIPEHLFRLVIVTVHSAPKVRDALRQVLVYGKKVQDVALSTGQPCETLRKHAQRLRDKAHEIDPDPWRDRLAVPKGIETFGKHGFKKIHGTDPHEFLDTQKSDQFSARRYDGVEGDESSVSGKG